VAGGKWQAASDRCKEQVVKSKWRGEGGRRQVGRSSGSDRLDQSNTRQHPYKLA
jgi:hypothetical protein